MFSFCPSYLITWKCLLRDKTWIETFIHCLHPKKKKKDFFNCLFICYTFLKHVAPNKALLKLNNFPDHTLVSCVSLEHSGKTPLWSSLHWTFCSSKLKWICMNKQIVMIHHFWFPSAVNRFITADLSTLQSVLLHWTTPLMCRFLDWSRSKVQNWFIYCISFFMLVSR